MFKQLKKDNRGGLYGKRKIMLMTMHPHFNNAEYILDYYEKNDI